MANIIFFCQVFLLLLVGYEMIAAWFYLFVLLLLKVLS